MEIRHFWKNVVADAWKKRSVIWLSGVRRAGKTCLCRSLPDVEYFDCELPRVRRMMDDPETFLENLRGRRIVLDEIHRLDRPSELLKIAADHYPGVRIIATGSSTLGASARFKDTLTGRKTDVWLTPMTLADMEDFRSTDIERRFLHGGLPSFFLSERLPERDFQEWMDTYWAKDVQELFRLERRHSFLKFTELLLAQSGGMFEASRFSAPSEVSRGTIMNYLGVLEATYVAHVLRPFSTRRSTEIVSAPKVYGFDTGFVCAYRGWDALRPEDMGVLWEHVVLNELHSRLQTRRIGYWRNKTGHEIDFVVKARGRKPIAIECKWSADRFDGRNMAAFLGAYLGATAYVVARDVNRPFAEKMGSAEIQFVGLPHLMEQLSRVAGALPPPGSP